MKVSVKIYREVEIKYLQVEAQVRYWEYGTVNGEEDTEGNLIPCKEGDFWKPLIDIDKGQIVNWEQGKYADVHYKICDNGSYYLLDSDKNVLLGICNDYVPDMLASNGKGDGDYIILTINEDGIIENWEADISDFTQDEFSIITD